jgi:uncharacterized protein (TIGR03067 family)
MRTLFALVVLFTALCGCSPTAPELSRPKVNSAVVSGAEPAVAATAQDSQPLGSPLEGTWGIVSAQSEGEPLLLDLAELRQVYAGNKIRFGKDANGPENEVRLDPNANPPTHDVTAGDRVERGIYRLEGDALTICSSQAPQARPDSLETQPGDGRTLMVFRRMLPEKLGQPISQEEADGFAAAIEKACQTGDARRLNALIDLEGMLHRITADYDIAKRQRLSFLYGLKSGSQILSDGPASLGGKIVQTAAGGGNLRVLRVVSMDGEWHVLVRLIQAGGGLNYQKYILGRDAFGNVVASDVFVFATGEMLTQTQRFALLPSLAALSPNGLRNVTSAELEYMKHYSVVREFIVNLHSGRFEAAEDIYHALPDAIQQQTWILLARLGKAPSEQRGVILQECLRLHADEPAFTLLAVEDAIRRKDVSAALAAIDRIEDFVGPDPYQDVLRSRAHELDGDGEAARKFMEKARTAEPELIELISTWPKPNSE